MNTKLNNEIKAILFDLDGTLIDINLDLFIPQYLKLLASKVSHLIKPSKFISNLMKASKAVDENDGSRTNDAVFAEAFFPLIGYPREEIDPYINEFYEKDFPKLKKYSQRKPEARKVMLKAIDRGYDIVIATTPLLPETAVIQRLEWGDVADFPYNLITSLENTCANKSNILYYKQILEKIGHPAEACLMVGDEDKDMAAARLGIKTFLVKSPQTKIDPSTPEPNYRGNLAYLITLL